MAKKILTLLLGIFFIFAGWNHFASHATYVTVVPPFLPFKSGLVDISGVAEILGGIGVFSNWTRRFAGFGLIALLLAVFPANIYMAVDHVMPGNWIVPIWALWARLPLQAVLIAWVYWTSCMPDSSRRLIAEARE